MRNGRKGDIRTCLFFVCLAAFLYDGTPSGNRGCVSGFLYSSINRCFRTISGNPRQFNYRDESAGLCVSAQKYNNKNLFLISPDSCIGFRKKASRICVENQEHFVL